MTKKKAKNQCRNCGKPTKKVKCIRCDGFHYALYCSKKCADAQLKKWDEDFPENQCRWCGSYLSLEEQIDGLCESCYGKMAKVEPD